ncbi:hypothetical protein ALC62_08219 [Cyphomyrmex costatus]|uniref:Uncharacterized protein n=1 Tax=Cyphomyrmex costatus TaxID=456900 RepID=A0A195CJV4_9HYME|nr:hypothetical protein ALC62_08219 [Cyphomyrmex costatus]
MINSTRWVKKLWFAIDGTVSCCLRYGDHTAFSKVQQVVSRFSMLRHHRCYSTDRREDLIRDRSDSRPVGESRTGGPPLFPRTMPTGLSASNEL